VEQGYEHVEHVERVTEFAVAHLRAQLRNKEYAPQR